MKNKNNHMENKNKLKLVAKNGLNKLESEVKDVSTEIVDIPVIGADNEKSADNEKIPEGYLKLPPMMDLILFHLSSVTFANEFYHHDAEYRYAFISECMKALTKLMNDE